MRRTTPSAATLVLGLLLGCTAVQQPDERVGPSPDASSCEDLCLRLDPVVLGAILPLTGPLAPLGQAQQRGVEAALEEANADGGVDVGGEQREVRLHLADDRGSPDAAGQFAWSFVLGRAQVTALLGVCAPPRPVLSVAEVREVPLVGGCGPLPSTGSPEPARWLWETGPSEGARADAALAALAAGGGRRLALFLSPGHPGEPWADAAAAHGVELAGTWTAPVLARRERVAADWSGPVAQARAAGADLVAAVTDPPDGVALWRDIAASGWEPGGRYASEAGLSSVWRSQVGAAAEGTVGDLHGDLAAGPDEALAAAARDATRVLLRALEAAGSDRRSAVNEAMAAAGARQHGTEAGSVPARLAQWRGDALVPLEP